MIDVHVLTHSETKKGWLMQCLRSLHGQACSVHVVEGVDGDIAAGRAKGFSQGSHPYVSFVDSDDWVLPGIMQACTEKMSQGHDAIVTDELVTVDERVIRVQPMHHLIVVRRDAMERILPDYRNAAADKKCCEFLIRTFQAERFGLVGYVWRKDGHGSHQKPTSQTHASMR